MDKLTLAHEYAKVFLTQNITRSVDGVVGVSFNLAEAMLAENEKRSNKELPESLKYYPQFDCTTDYSDEAKVMYDGLLLPYRYAKCLYENL